jgi:hypothetical protein
MPGDGAKRRGGAAGHARRGHPAAGNAVGDLHLLSANEDVGEFHGAPRILQFAIAHRPLRPARNGQCGTGSFGFSSGLSGKRQQQTIAGLGESERDS